MKMQKGIMPFLLLILLATISSCEQEAPEPIQASTTNLQDEIPSKPFKPSQSFSIENGMFVFENQDALLLTVHEIAAAKRQDVDAWEKSIGFQSQQSLFYEVMREADSIDNYYWSLPAEEQEAMKKQPEVHTQLYYTGLEEGWLKLEKDEEENSTYFQYGIVDPSMSAIVGKEGLVKIDNKIYQFTQDAIKILLSGNYEDVSLLTRSVIGDDENVVVFLPNNETSRSMSYNFSISKSWEYASNKKRYKMYINGSSLPSVAPIATDCTYGMSCTFQIRTEAQKKNFWGNWKYKADYGYSLSIGNNVGSAVWSYDYEIHNNGGNCGLSCIPGPSVSSYSCSGSSSAICPTSPYNAFYPWTNNGWFSLTPHGNWTLSNNYFCSAFDVEYLIHATYNIQWKFEKQ